MKPPRTARCEPPQAWNVGAVPPAGSLPPAPALRLTEVELFPAGSRHVRFLTGRRDATMLISTTIPDGERRLVGFISRSNLEALLREWPE